MNNEIIYEIYPLTFNYAEGSDSDPYKGAYGNLKGVTEMADYVKDLGVDTVWLAPFYKWNKTGMGYDIIDYYNVDPREVWLNAGMPWDGARGGFAKSYKDDDVSRRMALRPTPEQRVLAVDVQEKQPNSMLQATRSLLKRRKNSFLNEYGDVHFFETGNDEVIAFSRTDMKGNIKVFAYNFSDKKVKVKIPLENGALHFSLAPESAFDSYTSAEAEKTKTQLADKLPWLKKLVNQR